ncbi:Rieske 2Fe-2S domain-containing protein [soil metagenome]
MSPDATVQDQEPPADRSSELRVAAGFAVTLVCSVILAVVYRRGGNPRAEGVLLALAFGGLGYGFVVWAKRLLPQGQAVEEREALPTTTEQRGDFEENLERGGAFKRRKMLTRMLGLAGAGLAAAAVFPVRSLGPAPGQTLHTTRWRRGSRLVNEEGRPVNVDDVPVGGLVTVFPEGHVDADDSQVVLVKVEPGANRPRPGRDEWAPEDLVAYSKICTHAGCPVGLYQADTHLLLCPCHQSSFDVLDGARPGFGPATRSLPQLALDVDADGTLFARGDFDEPVGPAFWNRQ